MSDEGYTDEALLHDGDESAVVDDGDAASNENNGSANVVGGGDDPELEAIKARVKQGSFLYFLISRHLGLTL